MNVKDIYAFRLRNNSIESIKYPDFVREDELLEIEEQKKVAVQNIEAFISNKPYLNMLLWGERGCGKSSLIKMLLWLYKDKNLRIVEMHQDGMENIYFLYDKIRKNREYSFMIFFDDISFDYQDERYRKFKSILEGGIEETPKNVMFAATSNRRHLTLDKVLSTDDLYSHDDINEQLSLFGRFGLILGFYPLSRDSYLNIAEHYIQKYGIKEENWEKEAESYAIDRGGRSGRIAKQFAIYKHLKEENNP